MDDAERRRRLAERLPVADWLSRYTVRQVERRIRRYGVGRNTAKALIAAARKA